MALTQIAHQLIRQHFDSETAPTQLAIDATCGNGHDTLFLVELGFELVYGFDIQAQAIIQTKQRLRSIDSDHYNLIHDSHANIAQHIHTEIDCAMFNFGYLPGSDKQVTTELESSLTAIKASLLQLSDHGLISLMCYPGHPQGLEEKLAIELYLHELQQSQPTWQINPIQTENPKPHAPCLYLITKT